MTSAASSSYVGKYREIVLAVAFFLVFDLAVLVLNFYISYQISEDALAINMAGRQRMLSQRMTKALLIVESDTVRGLPNVDALAEVKKTVSLFEATLNGFEHGAMVTGGDGKPIFLAGVNTPEGRNILAKADLLWRPYKALLAPLTSDVSYTPQQFYAAEVYARANNLKLLGLMNDLTTNLEKTANAKADLLRRVQTGGILLALLNFAFILFKFIRRLRQNDRIVEAAQRETSEILGTVKEGLFLLDGNLKIGSQYSQSLASVLGRSVQAGTDFRQVLREMVPEATALLACDYIELLFGARVKESLVGELNPLTAVEVAIPGQTGSAARRYLTLQFSRAMEEGKISHLLVTVFDVTAQIELERALAEAKEHAKAEIEIMLDLLKIDPATLNLFLKNAETTLLEINELLRSAGGTLNYRSTVNTIFRKIHTLKGEAASLDLEMFESLAHRFEVLLVDLRQKGEVSGDDLLALPFPLEEFLQRVSMVRDIITRLAAYHNAFSPDTDHDMFADNLTKLAQRVALDQGKAVQLTTDLELMKSLPQKTRSDLKDIVIQLLRNAVTHGIETGEVREERAKPAVGNISLSLKPAETGEYELTLRDDGRGLIPDEIRAQLIRSGAYKEEQLEEMNDRQLVMKIFEPGFSTAQKAGRDAGHGVGMDVVKHRIGQLGARLRITTQAHVYTQFSIHFLA